MRGDEASPRSASWTSKWLHGTLYMTIRSSAVGTYSPAGIAAAADISTQCITPRLGTSRLARGDGLGGGLDLGHAQRALPGHGGAVAGERVVDDRGERLAGRPQRDAPVLGRARAMRAVLAVDREHDLVGGDAGGGQLLAHGLGAADRQADVVGRRADRIAVRIEH